MLHIENIEKNSLSPALTKDVCHANGEMLQLWQLLFNLACDQVAAALLCWQTNLGLSPGHCVCMCESVIDECEWGVGDQKRNVGRVEGLFFCVYMTDCGENLRVVTVMEEISAEQFWWRNIILCTLSGTAPTA